MGGEKRNRLWLGGVYFELAAAVVVNPRFGVGIIDRERIRVRSQSRIVKYRIFQVHRGRRSSVPGRLLNLLSRESLEKCRLGLDIKDFHPYELLFLRHPIDTHLL